MAEPPGVTDATDRERHEQVIVGAMAVLSEAAEGWPEGNKYERALNALGEHFGVLLSALEAAEANAKGEASARVRDIATMGVSLDAERAKREAAEADARQREQNIQLATSHLDFAIGFASTAENRAWGDNLLQKLTDAREALAGRA